MRYNVLVQEYLSNAFDYESYINSTDDVYYQKSVYEAFLAAQTALANATNKDEIIPAISAYDAAAAQLKASLEAYAQ